MGSARPCTFASHGAIRLCWTPGEIVGAQLGSPLGHDLSRLESGVNYGETKALMPPEHGVLVSYHSRVCSSGTECT